MFRKFYYTVIAVTIFGIACKKTNNTGTPAENKIPFKDKITGTRAWAHRYIMINNGPADTTNYNDSTFKLSFINDSTVLLPFGSPKAITITDSTAYFYKSSGVEWIALWYFAKNDSMYMENHYAANYLQWSNVYYTK